MTDAKRSTFPIAGILGVLFVGLKLGEVGVVKDWSWWWVTAPFWGPLALAVALLTLAGAFFLTGKGIDAGLYAWDQRKKAKGDGAK